MKDVIVKKSKIEGSGVFANKDFKKGEVVLKWDTSKQLSTKEVEKVPEDEKKYVSFVNNKYTLMRPPERYVNHSCNANTNVGDFCDVAKRDIKKGEEITGDYSQDTTPDFEMKCTCGSKNCKGIIKKE
ncbi:MAG: SET domain-containing protein [Nanoarchaeota archaeon]|nr:SET domain-containing protein [Nanoarchaeota archaeon]MBU1270275.1 SET domain-containing protein [Nanoarchaeota archaeon]MBU1604190.1 SET domain-containing protein [Nanoarchaeota archaeon]MBU2443145.1 SET domain-containing protein [Nanoarchaeota archaeon]